MSSSHPKSNRPAPHPLVRQARHLADVGDRWFLSVVQGIGRVGGWAQREVDALSCCGACGDCADPPACAVEPTEPPHSWRGFGLVAATPVDTDPASRPAAAPENPPGVSPLVEALGRVVADHEDRSYATLASDDRLWSLIDLLQSLGPERAAASPAGAGATAAPRASSTRGKRNAAAPGTRRKSG